MPDAGSIPLNRGSNPPLMKHTSYAYSSLPLGLLAAVLAFAGASAKDNPDPMAILQGLESVRLQIPPGELKLCYTHKDSLATNRLILDVDFDGQRRAFSYRPQPPAKGWQATFNGSQVAIYDQGRGDVQLMNLDKEMGMFLFDPRVLGLCAVCAWQSDVRSTLSLRWAVRAELIGRERVGDHQTWHVRLVMPFPRNIPDASWRIPPMDYWIDADKGFRVYRMEWNGAQTLSFYENLGAPYLPTRVVTTRRNNLATLGAEVIEWEILEAKWPMRFPASRWDLPGLGLQAETDVIDDRIQRRVGFWNGTRYVVLHPEVEQPSLRGRLLTWLVCGALFLLPPLMVWHRRWQAGRR